MSQNTKKLWYYAQRGTNNAYEIYNPNDVNSFVCQVCSEVEAKLIVKAVNCYDTNQETIKSQDAQLLAMDALLQKEKLKIDELIEALKMMRHFIPNDDVIAKNIVEKALSKAQEEI